MVSRRSTLVRVISFTLDGARDQGYAMGVDIFGSSNTHNVLKILSTKARYFCS